MLQTESVQMSESKRKRRKRTDDQGRTFTCHRCGRSYLSYPALYTHTKTKHADEPLTKTSRQVEIIQAERFHQKPDKSQQQKQKLKQKQHLRQKQKQQQKQHEQNYPLYGNSLPEVNNIEALKTFLFNYFPNDSSNSSHSYKYEMSNTQKKEFKDMKDYWAFGRKKQEELFNQVYQTPIKYVIGRFLAELETEVYNVGFKKYLITFTLSLKQAIRKIKQDDSYFNNHNASELPALLDQILREYFLFDSNDYLSNPTVAAKTLYYLGRWLYVNKFTNLSLKYNF